MGSTWHEIQSFLYRILPSSSLRYVAIIGAVIVLGGGAWALFRKKGSDRKT